jgi:hypothetical protein
MRIDIDHRVLTDSKEKIMLLAAYKFPDLVKDRVKFTELVQTILLVHKLAKKKKVFLIARNLWKDHIQERKDMKLEGESI